MEKYKKKGKQTFKWQVFLISNLFVLMKIPIVLELKQMYYFLSSKAMQKWCAQLVDKYKHCETVRVWFGLGTEIPLYRRVQETSYFYLQ